MKLRMVIGLLGALPLTLSRAEAAPILSLVPVASTVRVGDPLEVALRIAGVNSDQGALALGAYDVDVTFDSEMFVLSDVVIGDPELGDQLDLFALGSFIEVVSTAGRLNLFQVSFDATEDLNWLQADSFTLATFRLAVRAPLRSVLGIEVNALSDAIGAPLVALTQDAEISAVPEPGTMALITTGLIAISMRSLRGRRGRN